MTDNTEFEQLSTKERLLSETARIAWKELQRFFAQGVVLNVDPELDLVEVACYVAEDDAQKLSELVKDELVVHPSNVQARNWYQQDAQLWSVVVAPYVLVQEKE